MAEKIVRGVKFPADATPAEIEEFFASDSTGVATNQAGMASGKSGDTFGNVLRGAGGAAIAGGAVVGGAKALGAAGRSRAGSALVDAMASDKGPAGIAGRTIQNLRGGAPAASTGVNPDLMQGGPGFRMPTAPTPPPRPTGTDLPARTPTRPITVEGQPAAAPARTKAPRYNGGRGASKPELVRRAAMLKGEPIPGTVAAAKAAEAGALERGAGYVPDAELWRTRGISAPRGASIGRAAEVGGPAALELLLMLLNAAHAPQELDAAQQELQQRREQGMLPNDPRRWANQPHGY